ncbi:hypothetical protein DPMN_144593 [Dreissena polymorpha]|uniref:Uncharacterized protein n=1 Tax=Dreissena polymorpha TaxID=45954 RepID=A0A9D4JKU8_DREPO|nr:hypothetical protein DPMN_144593 [Dreissena polymorpha]
MATVRQYDGDNAIERWRHCDDTTATVRYDYRIVAPKLRKDKNNNVHMLETPTANVNSTLVVADTDSTISQSIWRGGGGEEKTN